MAKIKYDVSDVEDIAEGTHAPVGIYRAKVRSIDGPKQSSNGNPMLEVVLDLTHDGSGKKLKEQFNPLWYYPIMEHEHKFVQARWREFLLAFGLKPKGTLDTDKLVGKSIQVKLKSDTDDSGDYRPKVGKVMALAAVADEPEPEEEDAEDAEADGEEEDALDLDTLSRTELKKLIKDEELEIKVLKSMSDDDLRAAIAEAMGGDEEEEEAEDEEDEEEEDTEDEAEDEADDEEEDEATDYTTWSLADLKKEAAERELATNGSKKIIAARLKKDDESEPF